MLARSLAFKMPLPALTINSRKVCKASVASPSVDSPSATVSRCDINVRWSDAMRAMRVVARSACAAAVGSSLARTTRLPALRLSCNWARPDWRDCRLAIALW